jgi:hypothetical protein
MLHEIDGVVQIRIRTGGELEISPQQKKNATEPEITAAN